MERLMPERAFSGQSREDAMKYRPSGVCSREIQFEIKEGKLTDVSFYGGCSGNLQAIGRLVEGMSVEKALEKLEGIRCGSRPTSCADQLAKAIRGYQKKNQPGG